MHPSLHYCSYYSEVLMASVAAVHACVNARVRARTFVCTPLKIHSTLVWRSLFKGYCWGWYEWLTGVGEALITHNEIPEITLQNLNSKRTAPNC